MKKLTLKEQKEIQRLRGLFPREISAATRRSEDGGFFVHVTDLPGCFTEANTLSELVDMVNDAVQTVLGIPEKYKSYMPSYIPPIQVAQRLDAFPARRAEETVKMKLANREGAAC
jgi:predicted RNase H-like HicB family nuclease